MQCMIPTFNYGVCIQKCYFWSHMQKPKKILEVHIFSQTKNQYKNNNWDAIVREFWPLKECDWRLKLLHFFMHSTNLFYFSHHSLLQFLRTTLWRNEAGVPRIFWEQVWYFPEWQPKLWVLHLSSSTDVPPQSSLQLSHFAIRYTRAESITCHWS